MISSRAFAIAAGSVDSVMSICLATQKTPPQQAPMTIERVTRMTDKVKDEVVNVVNLWSAAWEEKNVPQYLAWYSKDFDVPGHQSRSQWEALRRSRIRRPASIDIDIRFDKFEIVEPDVVDVTFQQEYRSDVYSDVTNKRLRLRKEGTNWRILEEASL